MAQEAHQPIFHLKPADGAIASHSAAVQNVHWNFKQLAERSARSVDLHLP
ncbi:MAG TPA: hypothetical protein V6D20_21615 [Candidatus Obscuribacterales bacterium]